MPEMRETLTKTIQAAKTRVQEGKAKLVGLGRPKELLQVEVAGQEVSIPDETDQLTVTFTGVSGVKQEAQRGADIWLEKKPGEKPSLSSLARDIWKKTLGRPYFHHREQMYHEEVIAALGNDFKNKSAFEAATAQAEREYQEHLKNINVVRRAGRRGLEFVKSATGEVFGRRTWTRRRTLDILRNDTGRMQTETLTNEVNGTHTRLSEAELENNDAIRTKMGEQVALLNADPAAQAVVEASRNLMREYATTTMADDAFTEKSRELWQQLKQLKPEYFKAADFYTSSLFESAKALRVIAGHANGTVCVQNLVETAQFRIAYGKMGAATQTETAYTNRAVEWTHQHLGRFEQTPLGALLLNEATVGASAGLGIAGIQTATRTLATGLGRIVVPVFGGSAVGGAFAAAREYGAMGRQRLVHILEKEIGLSVPTTGKRREIMERFAPAQVAATEVLAKLRLPTDQNADSLRAFAGTVTDIQARLNMSAQAQNRIGLITFTKDQMERERADIYRAMRQARKHLTGLDAATTQAITGSPDVTMDTFLQNRTGIRTGEINKELYDLNQAFNVVRGKEAAKHGLKAAGVGMAAGVAGRLIGEMLHPTTAFEELAARTKVAAPTFRKAVGEMGKTRGLRGPWGWFEEHFSTANHNAKTNFAKNLLRGYEENVDHYQHVTGIPKEQFPWRIPGKLLNYNAMSKKLTFEVPERLFGDHALSLQDSIMEDAVKFHAGTLQNLTNNPLHLDAGQYKKLLEFFYTVGPGDHIPTAAEIARIDELLGGAQPPVEVAAEVVRETISPPPIPIGFHVPLEEVAAATTTLATPTTQLETSRQRAESSPSYPSLETFKPTQTLNSLIRIHHEEREDEPVQTHGRYKVQFKEFATGNITEGENALEAIQQTFQQSKHIYIALSGAIGDAVVTTAYIDGIRQYAQKMGPDKQITLVAPSLIATMLAPLAQKYNFEIITEERHHCVPKAQDLIHGRNENNTVIFDFDFTEENGPYPILEQRKNGNIVVHELLSTAVGLYTNERSRNKRYGEYLGDLLHIPQNERLELHPILSLPENATDIYEGLVTQHGIDANKKQIAVVVEGSGDYKRYALDQWSTVLKELTGEDVEINVIYRKGGSYTEEELRIKLGLIQNVRFIDLPLLHAAVLLQKQTLVLSNDTGLAHIAAVIENGPKVISLHAYNNTPNIWVTNPERQTGLWSGADDKPVSEIPPEHVIQTAKILLSQLSAQPASKPLTNPPPPTPPTAEPTAELPETIRPETAPTTLETRLKKQSKAILENVRWQLNFADEKAKRESTPFDPKSEVDALIRGNVAEQYSTLLPITDGKNVSSPQQSFSHITPTTLEKEFGAKSKERILEKIVRKSLKDKPLKIKDTMSPEEYDDMVEEIVLGYTQRPEDRDQDSVGMFYRDSRAIDGILKNDQGEIVGFSEVKSHFPHEYGDLIDKLPEQLLNEVNFVDTIRTVGFGQKALQLDTFILLRLPADAPDEAVRVLQQRLRDRHFSNVLIQKMPLTSKQIAQEAKKFVRNNLRQIRNGAGRFQPEGIELLEWYAQQPEKMATTISTPTPEPQ